MRPVSSRLPYHESAVRNEKREPLGFPFLSFYAVCCRMRRLQPVRVFVEAVAPVGGTVDRAVRFAFPELVVVLRAVRVVARVRRVDPAVPVPAGTRGRGGLFRVDPVSGLRRREEIYRRAVGEPYAVAHAPLADAHRTVGQPALLVDGEVAVVVVARERGHVPQPVEVEHLVADEVVGHLRELHVALVVRLRPDYVGDVVSAAATVEPAVFLGHPLQLGRRERLVEAGPVRPEPEHAPVYVAEDAVIPAGFRDPAQYAHIFLRYLHRYNGYVLLFIYGKTPRQKNRGTCPLPFFRERLRAYSCIFDSKLARLRSSLRHLCFATPRMSPFFSRPYIVASSPAQYLTALDMSFITSICS